MGVEGWGPRLEVLLRIPIALDPQVLNLVETIRV